MEGFLDTATQLCIDWGYWGLFLSAFVAGSIVPFSSEAVMVVLVRLGLDPALCLLAAATGNTAGGMTCYWIGTLGRTEWITRLGVSTRQLARARKGGMERLFRLLALRRRSDRHPAGTHAQQRVDHHAGHVRGQGAALRGCPLRRARRNIAVVGRARRDCCTSDRAL